MQDKRNIENVVQEIMGLVGAYGTTVHDNSTGNPSDYTLAHAESAAYNAIESKLRELVREQEEAKKYADMLAICMFKKHYAQDEPYASGAVKFELFDSLPSVISQIDNMASGLERAHGITNASGAE